MVLLFFHLKASGSSVLAKFPLRVNLQRTVQTVVDLALLAELESFSWLIATPAFLDKTWIFSISAGATLFIRVAGGKGNGKFIELLAALQEMSGGEASLAGDLEAACIVDGMGELLAIGTLQPALLRLYGSATVTIVFLASRFLGDFGRNLHTILAVCIHITNERI